MRSTAARRGTARRVRIARVVDKQIILQHVVASNGYCRCLKLVVITNDRNNPRSHQQLACSREFRSQQRSAGCGLSRATSSRMFACMNIQTQTISHFESNSDPMFVFTFGSSVADCSALRETLYAAPKAGGRRSRRTRVDIYLSHVYQSVYLFGQLEPGFGGRRRALNGRMPESHPPSPPPPPPPPHTAIASPQQNTPPMLNSVRRSRCSCITLIWPVVRRSVVRSVDLLQSVLRSFR